MSTSFRRKTLGTRLLLCTCWFKWHKHDKHIFPPVQSSGKCHVRYACVGSAWCEHSLRCLFCSNGKVLPPFSLPFPFERLLRSLVRTLFPVACVAEGIVDARGKLTSGEAARRMGRVAVTYHSVPPHSPSPTISPATQAVFPVIMEWVIDTWVCDHRTGLPLPS